MSETPFEITDVCILHKRVTKIACGEGFHQQLKTQKSLFPNFSFSLNAVVNSSDSSIAIPFVLMNLHILNSYYYSVALSIQRYL